MKILLFGKEGQVGWELQRSLSLQGQLRAVGLQDVDMEDPDGLRKCIHQNQPDILVNAAAYTAVDKAESEPAKAYRVNAEAVGVMAEEARKLNAWLVHFSTDYVFDGEKSSPYKEDDPVCPLSVYGKSKLEGEQLIQKHHDKHLIFRTSWVYAARGNNFAKTMLRLAGEKDELKVIADQHGAPTSAELIADVTALAIYRISRVSAEENFAGIYHLVAGGETSWHGFAQYVLELAQSMGVELKTSAEEVQSIPTSAYPLPATRPQNSRLNTSKLCKTFNINLPNWHFHVQRLVSELVIQEAF